MRNPRANRKGSKSHGPASAAGGGGFHRAALPIFPLLLLLRDLDDFFHFLESISMDFVFEFPSGHIDIKWWKHILKLDCSLECTVKLKEAVIEPTPASEVPLL